LKSLYYDARSEKHQRTHSVVFVNSKDFQSKHSIYFLTLNMQYIAVFTVGTHTT